MSITPEDKCFVCRKTLINMPREQLHLHTCPHCGIYVCNSCFEKMDEAQKTLCPNCGKSNRV